MKSLLKFKETRVYIIYYRCFMYYLLFGMSKKVNLRRNFLRWDLRTGGVPLGLVVAGSVVGRGAQRQPRGRQSHLVLIILRDRER